MEIGDTHDPYGAIVTGPNVRGCIVASVGNRAPAIGGTMSEHAFPFAKSDDDVGFRRDARATTRKGAASRLLLLGAAVTHGAR
jgi:hypothetical protein